MSFFDIDLSIHLNGGKGEFLRPVQKNTKSISNTHSKPFVKLSYAMQQLLRRGQGAGSTKEKYPLNTSTDEKHYPLGTVGKDFRAPEPAEEYIIQICGDTVILNNGLLVEALSRLPVWKQEMVYLSYFRHIPQREIGRRYGRSRSAAGYHIRKAVRQLHEEMEGMTHEE